MRTFASLRSGAIQTRTLTVILLFAALAGVLILLLNRATLEPVRVEIPSATPEVSRTNLLLEAGRLRLKDGTAPFSGLMVEQYPDGTMRSRSMISNGVLNGLSEGWHTNAQIQVAEHFKEGISHGVRTKWYPSGAKQSEADIVNGKLHGTYRKWHENGTLSEQVEFVADQPEGVSMSYFPSGYLKARVVMRGGRVAEQHFWNDLEKKE